MRKRKNQQGFTLVELSIVLIIIGLIVGGVLAGQTIIASAKSQADVTNYNKMNTAENAFYLKYNYVPGDAAVSPVTITYGGAVVGNADGFVGTAITATYDSEIGLAMEQLAAAGLIPIPTNQDAHVAASNAPNVGYPQSKTGGGMIIYGDAQYNWLRFGMVAPAVAALALQENTLMTPAQASFIDNKLDDGIATTGIVQTVGQTIPGTSTTITGASGTSLSPTFAGALSPAGVGCNSAAGVGGGVYATGTTAVCSLQIRLSQ